MKNYLENDPKYLKLITGAQTVKHTERQATRWMIALLGENKFKYSA